MNDVKDDLFRIIRIHSIFDSLQTRTEVQPLQTDILRCKQQELSQSHSRQ